jgi:serine/threonine protein kinase/Tfp pilus assembly protein PilF
MNKELTTNSTLSHYRIVSRIGAGGMGEVYRALDTKLDRNVAIKFLNQEFSKDTDKLNRFIQEAKAASALNHPNILTVYEIGEVDGKNYIATELIDGQTLREHLSHKESLQLNQILKIGVQVSEALSAAHQAGIIHRDIKPENIMLRKDGYAKVLDFGLAKLSERHGGGETRGREEAKTAGNGEGNTLIAASPPLPVPASPVVNTTPGLVMGTVSYMSPEQARGRVTDARTDIWSLGVVLYEMLSGKVPFTGETINHTIVSILEREPLLLENVPAELQRIVRKSMTKDVDMRYQTARDLLIDLKNLRRDLDIQGELERSVVPGRGATGDSSTENETKFYSAGAEAIQSGSVAETQNITRSSSSLEYAVTQAKSHKLVSAIAGIVLLGIVATIGYFAFIFKGSAGQINSIAVMPFVNESGNADVEYLSDGMTETLINSLSQIPNLSVKARSSVFRYKGREIDPKKVASELGVQAILTGRVVQRADQLMLNVELMDAASENILWGNKYERKSSDLVSLQADIARDVSSNLKSKLSGADAAKVEKSYTANPEAYQLYLKGRFSWNKRTPESLKQAIGFYEQAIAKDPNYALAFSGLAETYVLFSFYGVAPAKESMPKAKAAIDRALAIDDSIAEAHAARGKYLAFFEFDRNGSEREFRRAIELNPNYATAYQWLGLDFLVLTRRFDEGIRELRRAGEIDPLSPVIGSDTASALGYAGRFDEAIDQARRTLELEPGFSYAHTMLGYALDGKGQFDEAISEYEKAISLTEDGYTRALLIRALMRTGRRSEAERQMEALRTFASTSYVPNFCFSIAHTALGDKEAAIAMLEKDVEERSSYAVTIGIEIGLNELRNEPRFKALLKRLNLPE